MTEAAIAPTKTPWHVWAVGALTLLWNAYGAYDYLMKRTNNAEYLAAFTAQQQAFLAATPMWAVVMWTIGVWGAVIGSVLILLRSRYAWMFTAASLAGFLANLVYNYGLSDGSKVMGGGAGLTVMIAVVLVAQLWYAWSMSQRGVLR